MANQRDIPFLLRDEQQEAFNEFRQCMQSHPVLAHFDEDAETELHTYTSKIGQGAVLVQRQEGIERVIASASRTLSHAE